LEGDRGDNLLQRKGGEERGIPRSRLSNGGRKSKNLEIDRLGKKFEIGLGVGEVIGHLKRSWDLVETWA